MVLGGDVMLGRGVDRVIAAQGPAYPLHPLAPVLTQGDLVVVNLECAITRRHRSYAGRPKAFLFQAGAHGAEVLGEAGIGLVSLANNHVLDAGEEGLADTLFLLDEWGVRHAGAGASLAAAQAPAIVDIGRTRIGMLSCCDHQADFAAHPGGPGMWYLDMRDDGSVGHLLGSVRRLAAQVSHVMVALHWQPNWAPTVAAVYRALGASLLDAGAAVVLGHSPHHFQGVEWAGPGSGVVVYSAGDLVNDYAVDPSYRNDRQLVFQVGLGPRGRGVRWVRAHPVELEFGRTTLAGPSARAWIVERFRAMCAGVGTTVQDEGEGWLDIVSGS